VPVFLKDWHQDSGSDPLGHRGARISSRVEIETTRMRTILSTAILFVLPGAMFSAHAQAQREQEKQPEKQQQEVKPPQQPKPAQQAKPTQQQAKPAQQQARSPQQQAKQAKSPRAAARGAVLMEYPAQTWDFARFRSAAFLANLGPV
jgi:hypothetical protein